MSQAAPSEHVIAHLADTTAPPVIVMDKVNKWFGSLHVLRDVSLSVAEKERVVVCARWISCGVRSAWYSSRLTCSPI